jgi:hypothetical protein
MQGKQRGAKLADDVVFIRPTTPLRETFGGW